MLALLASALTLVVSASAQAPAPQADVSPWTFPSDIRSVDDATFRAFGLAVSEAVDKHNSGDYAASETAWRTILAQSETIWGPNHPLTAVALRNLADELNILQRDAEAENYYRRALVIYDQRIGQARAPNTTAQICASLGKLLIERQERAGEAITLLTRVIALRGRDRNTFIYDNWHLISAYLIADRHEDAARVGAEALELAEREFSYDPLAIAEAQRLYGSSLDQSLRSQEAQSYFALSQTTARNFWQSSSPEVRERRRAEFAALLPFGFDDTPERLRARALQLLTPGAALQTIDPEWRATLRTYGEAAFDAGRRDEAHRVLRELARLQEAAGDTPIERNETLWLAATYLQSDQQDVEAERVIQQVVALDRGSGSYANSALYLWQLAAVNVRLGRIDVAERALNDMVAVADLAGGPGSRYALQYRNLQAVVLLNANRAEAAERAARATWRAYQERNGVPMEDRTSQNARQASTSDTALLFAAAVWAQEGGRTLASSRAGELFEAMQDITSSASANALAAGAARIAAGHAGLGELAADWLDAQEEIAAIDERVLSLGNTSAAERATLLASRRGQETRRRQAEENLRAQFGDFFELLMPSRIPLAETQAALGNDEALVLLTPGMPTVNAYATHLGFVFVVTREGTAWARLGLAPSELAAEIAALHGMLQAGGATRSPGVGAAQTSVGGARGYDRARAHRLYQTLFGSPQVAALLQNKRRWTLAPQGVLLGAPFAALVTQAPEGGASGDASPASLRATHWLGLERTLAITPSVSALRAQRGDAPVAGNPQIAFFGLGDPSFDGAPGPVRGLEMRAFFRERSADVAAVRALPRLPGTRHEIEQLAAAFGARREDYVLDVLATESELKRRNSDGRLARAEVIAFATHGLMAGDLAGSLAEPALALSPPQSPSENDDGLLTASEAARLRLSRARWVILSACNTASGDEPDAEGLTGLARAFFYAGARTLLVSQWQVNDQAAQRLTTRAVALQRAERISTAEAMRRSMAELLGDDSGDQTGRSLAHPSAWAPFVLVSGE